MSERPGYKQHGSRHHPTTGSDPITGLPDHVIWPTPYVLPLGRFEWATGGGGVTLASDRKNNFKAEIPSGNSTSLQWRIPCGPIGGGYTLMVVSALGPTYGTMTAKIAGAYPASTISATPADWITLGTYDFSNGSPVVYNELRVPGLDIGTVTSGIIPTWGPADFGEEGVTGLYTKSTSISGGGLLNGGSGYYFLGLDLTGYFELSEAVVTPLDTF